MVLIWIKFFALLKPVATASVGGKEGGQFFAPKVPIVGLVMVGVFRLLTSRSFSLRHPQAICSSVHSTPKTRLARSDLCADHRFR